MHAVKLTIAGLVLVGLASTACQRTDDQEFGETGDTTVIAVPDAGQIDSVTIDGSRDTASHAVKDGKGNSEQELEKQVVVIREPAPPPAPRRRAAVEEVRDEDLDSETARPREGAEPVREPAAQREIARVTVPAGTNVFVTTETALSSKTSLVGDPVAARTAENINVNGQVVVPAGALVEGHVTAVETAGNPGEMAYIDLAFDRVRLANGDWLPISGVLAGKAGEEVKGSSNTPRNVAIGAGAGAVLGQVIGGDTKSTVIGAVLGAGAGAAAGQATRDTYVVVPSGSRINVQLTSAVSVPLS